ncbi:MAG: 2-amino-4-hydroxy-6-hydroxymethyldihydropteridine diphosphokinase [Planctomycetota bacterium]|nr:2-amino-4-hydroxy-6-hydroxymethyldihydropteridine diphosphokinase [Planctomycetota bacterium]
MTSIVYIGFGTNVGDREDNYDQAIKELNVADGVSVSRASRLHEYPPMGPPQPDYLNGAIEISTTLRPAELLAELNRIEAALGRERVIHWGPRTVDLDILFWGDLILNTETLTIPHPGACERLFVLEPLVEIAPDLSDPRSGQKVSEILASLRS